MRSDGPRGIDIQSHYLVPSYMDALTNEARDDAGWASTHVRLTGESPDSQVRTLEGRVEDMSRAGVRLSVLSVPAVVFRNHSRAIEAARKSNQELVEVAASDPNHFRVMASLPIPFVDDCLQELGTIHRNPLVAGLIMPTGTSVWTLEEARFWPIYAAIEEAGLPFMLHPALEPWPLGFEPWRLGSSMAVTIETSLAAMRLILSGVLDRFPRLAVIVPHLGGVLPYLTQRLVDKSGRGDAEEDVAYYLQSRLFYDNNSYHKPALKCAIETVGADRIMLGSDYPFRGELSRCVDDILNAGLDDRERNQILSGTAESVMRNLTSTSAR
jgi:predicted TIM-barrel fold metal-dependent hydrolase